MVCKNVVGRDLHSASNYVTQKDFFYGVENFVLVHEKEIELATRGSIVKLDIKTIRWCRKWLRKQAKICRVIADRRNWDSTTIAPSKECLDRAWVLERLADEMLNEAKELR